MMNRSTWTHCVASIATLLAGPALSAEDAAPTRWFFQSSAGVSRADDVQATLNFTQRSVPATFKDGGRLDVIFGYWLRPGFAVATESGYLQNSMDSIEGANTVRANLRQMPLLVDLVWRSRPEARISPLLGVGVGVVVSELKMQRATLQRQALHGSELTSMWAAQAFFGVDWRVGDKARIGAVYKYLRTESPTWDLHSYDATKAYGVVKLGDLSQQSIQLTATLDF